MSWTFLEVFCSVGRGGFGRRPLWRHRAGAVFSNRQRLHNKPRRDARPLFCPARLT